MIKKNTSAFRKPIDRKTEDYVIVKGSKTKAMPEHKNNVKFFPFFFFSGKKVNWYIIAKYHLFLKWFVVNIGLYLVSSHSGSSLYCFFYRKQLFLQGVSFKCILHKNNCLCRRSSAAQFAFYNDYNIHVRYQIQDKKYWGDC